MASPRQQRQLANLSLIETETVIRVEQSGDGERVDRLIRNRLGWLSQGKVKQLADANRVLRNGGPVPAGRKAKTGDVITVLHDKPFEDVSEMDRIRWETLHEDEAILVINKPPHLVVHPAGAYRYTTLLNALHKKYLGDRDNLTEDDPVPRLVHRIDKETSGVLVVAFSRDAHGTLGKLFQERSDEVEKEYVALVEGRVEWDAQSITLPLGQAPNDPIRLRRAVVADGQPARTDVTLLERFKLFTLVRCKLFTGRQHQIRVHMQAVGHPLVGDHLYGIRDELRQDEVTNPDFPRFREQNVYLDETVSDVEAADRIREVDLVKRREYWEIEAGRAVYRDTGGRLLMSRCALHCALMAFPHPATGEEMRVEASLTADFKLALEYLRAVGK
jgi:23S rRNA pseudouridine1911/1915/1917 synthase